MKINSLKTKMDPSGLSLKPVWVMGILVIKLD